MKNAAKQVIENPFVWLVASAFYFAAFVVASIIK